MRVTRSISRRRFGLGAASVAAGVLEGSRILSATEAFAAPAPLDGSDALIAKPPAGFVPYDAPGRIVKVQAKGGVTDVMQPNQLWPKADVAKRLIERAMMDFTGASNLAEAMKRFVHKDDVVAIKVNGIAGQNGQTMAVNFELILPVVEAVIAAGVPVDRVTVYEQYPTYLNGTRVNVKSWQLPAGVKTDTHNNMKHKMRDISVYQGVKTRFCDTFMEATAVIDMTQIKDHSICGYTGTMKNITHGNINNPEDHHAHNASPQIALLYNHPIVTSRVRLHITDGFKVTYDKGPLDKDPKTRIVHGAVYVATDAVAMDTFGYKVVEDERKARGLKSLKDVLREPKYIQTAAELGLGVGDLNQVTLKSAEI
jgi:uncharacterized protein (DUF362 family)